MINYLSMRDYIIKFAFAMLIGNQSLVAGDEIKVKIFLKDDKFRINVNKNYLSFVSNQKNFFIKNNLCMKDDLLKFKKKIMKLKKDLFLTYEISNKKSTYNAYYFSHNEGNIEVPGQAINTIARMYQLEHLAQALASKNKIICHK